MNYELIDDLLKPDDYEILKQNFDGGFFFSVGVYNGVNTPGDGDLSICHVFYTSV